MTSPHLALSCQVCHRAPAMEIHVRRHVGMVLLMRFVSWRGVVCREHGLMITKEFLKKTLVQGWWGYLSFVINWFVIAKDLMVQSKLKKLDEPQPLPGTPADEAIEAAPEPGQAFA
ncbi:MAG: hypothetical protein QOJ92_2042 [Frankiales bacterium]|nr:hypothetical protein [Frankiales bacterium]